MSIMLADNHQFDLVKAITINTIKEIYPHYYPRGAVDFFLAHHNDENIMRDIQAGMVYLNFHEDRHAVGTITIRENELCRLFILPQYQKQGYGRELIDFAEHRISEHYPVSILDASLPAKAIYLKRGYIETETHSILTESGDFLCYDVMQKKLIMKVTGWT